MARRFRFSLQTALDLRTRLEDEARRRFAEAQRALQVATETQARIQSVRAATVEQVKAEPPDLLLNGSRYIEHLNQQLAGASALVQRRTQEAEMRRQELLAASQDRQALDRLRDRRQTEHERELRRLEERELGEAGARSQGAGMAISAAEDLVQAPR